jgi:magnesium chelatase accessory protein
VSATAGGRLDWNRDGADWPNRAHSEFVEAAGLRWHVQRAGAGPALLLIHGTGAATHTWRDLLLPLAERRSVIAVDLPGHGFTSPLPAASMTLPGMSRALAGLVRQLGTGIEAVIGHSAGAAIGARLCLDGAVTAGLLISLNGVLLPPDLMPLRAMSVVARFLAATSLAPRLFAWSAADPAAVRRLVDSTGSVLDARGYELYQRLTRNPAHAASVLDMLAGWDLAPLERDLPRLKVPLVAVASLGDRAVPPMEADRLAARVPGSRVIKLPRLGHLAHEEDPAGFVRLFESLLESPTGCAVPAGGGGEQR